MQTLPWIVFTAEGQEGQRHFGKACWLGERSLTAPRAAIAGIGPGY
jgi:hypothetical protein